MENILQFISERLGKKDSAVLEAASWKELGLDSLDTVELIIDIEDKFGVEIKEEDAERLKNFNELMIYLKEKQGN